MEIKTLVIVGFLLILISSGLFFYINLSSLLNRLKFMKQNLNFKTEKTGELQKIDQNIYLELNKKDVSYDKVKSELEYIKKSVGKKEVDREPNDLKEVFLVENNIFSKSEAPKVCRGLFNSDAATKEQLNESYNNGANWCNYGWTSDGDAYYPLQSDTNNSVCEGNRGLNGGTMADKNYKLGALCYGVKPEDNKFSNLDKLHQESSFAEDDIKMLENYRKKLVNDGIKVAPFNDKTWSRYSYKTDTMAINDKVVISNKKECSNDPQALDTNKSKIQAII